MFSRIIDQITKSVPIEGNFSFSVVTVARRDFNLMRVSVTKYQINFDAKIAYGIFRKKALTRTATT